MGSVMHSPDVFFRDGVPLPSCGQHWLHLFSAVPSLGIARSPREMHQSRCHPQQVACFTSEGLWRPSQLQSSPELMKVSAVTTSQVRAPMAKPALLPY